MTLHVYDKIEQGADEWMAARRGMVTALECHKQSQRAYLARKAVA